MPFLKIKRRTKLIFKNNFLIFNLLIFSFYSNLINARPFSIADEVGSNNYNNYNQQLTNNFVVDSNEREQYKEAMQIARDTFFQLRPLQQNEEIEQQNNKNKLKFLTSLNKRRNKLQNKQKAKERNFLLNGEGGSAEDENIESEHIPQQQPPPLLHSSQAMLPLHISADIVNNTLQSDTCQGDLFKHKVKVNGCKPKTITNRFCHGSCSSFYIPRLRSKKLKATFQSCSACIPAEMDTIQIRLECPDLEKGFLYRKIVRVKKCACRNIMLEGEEIGENENMEDGEEENVLNDYEENNRDLEG
uniref:Bursicon n=1 Tax=Meloidogyne hapla TaxID=6305 RepID=A0A1I8B1L2_MELHA